MIAPVTRRYAVDRTALGIALLGLAVHVALVVALLAGRDGAIGFVEFGSGDPAAAHAREVFGDDLVVVGEHGHDGQVFWALAHDPLLVDADRVAGDLDRPAYRARRVLYPALASPWLVAGEDALLWGLIVTNLVVVLAGGYATALLARDNGAPPRAALAFALSPLVLLSLAMDVADAMAAAFVVAFVLAAGRRRWWLALAAAVLAGLAKESSLLAVVAVAALAPAVSRRRRALLVGVPLLAVGLWAFYVRWRLGSAEQEVREFALPFQGFVEAVDSFYPDRSSAADLAVSFALVPLAAFVIVRWWQRRSLLMTAALPFAALVPFLGAPVVYLPINSVRALGPLITFLVLDLYATGIADRVNPRREAPAATR